MKGLPHVFLGVGPNILKDHDACERGESAALARHCHCQEVILKIVADREAEKSSESIIRAIRERGKKEGRTEEIEMRIDKRKKEHNSASGQRQQSPSPTPARVCGFAIASSSKSCKGPFTNDVS